MIIVDDSIISDIKENRMLCQWRKFKVKHYHGATEDICGYIKLLLKKCPENTILHGGINSTIDETLRSVLDKHLYLKVFDKKVVPNCNICICNLTYKQMMFFLIKHLTLYLMKN